MRTNWYLSLGLVSLTLSVLALAAPATQDDEQISDLTPATAVEAEAPVSTVFDGPFPIGSIDIRPSYYPDGSTTGDGTDGIGLENNVELGAQLSPNVSILYSQAFNTNLYDANNHKDISIADGFLRTRVLNIWQSADQSWSLGYENRIYLPVVPANRGNGQITTVRNYLNLTKKFSDTLSVTASIVPIVHIFNRGGNMVDQKDATGTVIGQTARANPAFENRFYLIPTITLAPRLTLSLPLFFHQSLSRSYAGNPGKWTFMVWTWPELMYGIDDNQSIGIAYYSDPLTTDNIRSDFEFLGGGALQLVYHAAL